MKTYVYIDGFNLFRGCLSTKSPTDHRGHWGVPGSMKWLNLEKFCTLKFPKDHIEKISYFTAKIEAREDNPRGPQNQEVYLRALATIPKLEIIRGFHQTHPVWARIHGDHQFETQTPPSVQDALLASKTKRMRVLRTEEKLTDVNLAVRMVRDAAKDCFELAVLVANDADYREALRIVTQDFNKKVGLLCPYPRPSQNLKKFAFFTHVIEWPDLVNAQFPHALTDRHGRRIHKPDDWG